MSDTVLDPQNKKALDELFDYIQTHAVYEGSRKYAGHGEQGRKDLEDDIVKIADDLKKNAVAESLRNESPAVIQRMLIMQMQKDAEEAARAAKEAANGKDIINQINAELASQATNPPQASTMLSPEAAEAIARESVRDLERRIVQRQMAEGVYIKDAHKRAHQSIEQGGRILGLLKPDELLTKEREMEIALKMDEKDKDRGGYSAITNKGFPHLEGMSKRLLDIQRDEAALSWQKANDEAALREQLAAALKPYALDDKTRDEITSRVTADVARPLSARESRKDLDTADFMRNLRHSFGGHQLQGQQGKVESKVESEVLRVSEWEGKQSKVESKPEPEVTGMVALPAGDSRAGQQPEAKGFLAEVIAKLKADGRTFDNPSPTPSVVAAGSGAPGPAAVGADRGKGQEKGGR